MPSPALNKQSINQSVRHCLPPKSPDHLRPLGVEELAFGLVQALIGVSTEEVALGLQQVGRQTLGAVAVVVAQGGGEGRSGDAVQGGEGHHFAPVLLGLAEHALEEGVEHQVHQAGVGAVGVRDAVEEARTDDATATPDGGDAAEVEAPALLLAHGLDEVQTLCVGDDLGGVEGVVHLLHQLSLVGRDVGGRAGQLLAGCHTLLLLAGEDAGLHSGVDGADHHRVFRGVEERPLAGAFLAGLVHDELDHGLAGLGVHLLEGLAGDLDEVALEVAFVPLVEDRSDLSGGEASVLEDVVGFADELHVAVLDAVVDHLHIVAGAAGADVDDAGLTVHLGGDAFKDGLHHLPGAGRAAGHDGGAFAGAFFAAGNASADEAEAFFSEISVTALGGLVEAVAAVDDDVALVEEGDELLDHRVHGVTVAVLHRGGLHHDLDLPGSGQALHELFQSLRAHQFLTRMLRDELVRRGGRAVENGNLEAAAFHVKDKVLAHHGQADESEVAF